MNKIILLSSILAVSAPLAQADDNRSTARKAGVFFSSAIAGAAVAGPIGMVAGAFSGVWLDQQVEKADELAGVESDLAEANAQLSSLDKQLARAVADSQKYAQIALDQLQLEMMFKTGASNLTDAGKNRLALLADFMSANKHLNIRLDGYADPRGNAEYNRSLSEARVASVASQLLKMGVAQDRLKTYSHGDSQSNAANGDYDSYALERVVRIQLSKNGQQNSVAQVSVSH